MADFIYELDPPPGIDSDNTTFAAKGRYADGSNVRFYLGRAQPIGGTSGSLDSSYTSVTKLFVYKVSAAVYVLTCGLSLRRHQLGNTTVNITPVGWALQSGQRCSAAMWGDTLLVNPSGAKLYESSSGATATHVTQAPAQITTILSTEERQLLALGANEEVSGTFNGRCIRGCDIEDFTTWTAATDNNAFEHILPGQASIVGGCVLGSNVLVWTSEALFLGEFLGNPGQTYRFNRVADVGLIGMDAFAIHHGRVFWLSPDLTFHTYGVGTWVEDVPCPIHRELLTNCSTSNRSRIFAWANARRNEIWWHYPDTRDAATDPSRYVAFSITETQAAQTPVWFRGVQAWSAVVDDALLVSDLSTYSTTTVAISPSAGEIRAFDCRATAVAQTSWHIQSADQYIESARRRVMLNRIIPDFEDQGGNVTLTLYVRDHPQSSATTKGPYTLAMGEDKVDLRASGKIVAAKFSGSSIFARFGKLSFDGVTMGMK